MSGLFKLIFYIIIGVVYYLSNKQHEENDRIKKQAKEQLRKQTELSLKKEPRVQPDIPQREGAFEPDREEIDSNKSEDIKKIVRNKLNYESFDAFKRSYHNEIQKTEKKPQKHKKTQKQRPEPVLAEKTETAPASAGSYTVKYRKTIKKGYPLKSSIKEGIIWSIVLGPPKAKQMIAQAKCPVNR